MSPDVALKQPTQSQRNPQPTPKAAIIHPTHDTMQYAANIPLTRLGAGYPRNHVLLMLLPVGEAGRMWHTSFSGPRLDNDT
jgi:hypothetical protein